VFDKDNAHILCGPTSQQWKCTLPTNEILLSGERDSSDDLWHWPIHINESCHTLSAPSNIKQRVAYYHSCLGSPPISTWCNAIDAGHLSSFPALTSAQVRKYCPPSIATYMGHLDQTRQGQVSTKIRPLHSRDLYLGIIHDEIATPIVPHRPGTIYSDPTGRFIIPSSQGNQYILVVYDVDSNYIFAEPMPSRSALQIVKAYDKIQSLLSSRGITPYLHILDNEVSTLLKSYITQHGIQYQIVSPNQHRANAAERAIRTFKNHFIPTLCSCDPTFPLHLWDRLIDQAIITLNLMRTSTINNRLSAYAQLHGPFNFTATPLGPPGTKVIIHDKPGQRGTWAPHGTIGWYIGPAMDHYRNFRVYVPSTNSIRRADSLAWFSTSVTMPTASSTDIAMAAAYDLTQALLSPSPPSAWAPLSDSQRQALYELASIFGTITQPPTEPVLALEPRVSPTLSIHTDPRVPTDEPRVPPIMDCHIDPRVPTDEPRVPPTVAFPGDPRVPTDEPMIPPAEEFPIEPRMHSVEPRGLSGVDPREATAEPRVVSQPVQTHATVLTEPLSSHLTTNVPVTQSHIDLSYNKYNHNGPQRQRTKSTPS